MMTSWQKHWYWHTPNYSFRSIAQQALRSRVYAQRTARTAFIAAALRRQFCAALPAARAPRCRRLYRQRRRFISAGAINTIYEERYFSIIEERIAISLFKAVSLCTIVLLYAIWMRLMIENLFWHKDFDATPDNAGYYHMPSLSRRRHPVS